MFNRYVNLCLSNNTIPQPPGFDTMFPRWHEETVTYPVEPNAWGLNQQNFGFQLWGPTLHGSMRLTQHKWWYVTNKTRNSTKQMRNFTNSNCDIESTNEHEFTNIRYRYCLKLGLNFTRKKWTKTSWLKWTKNWVGWFVYYVYHLVI